MTPQEHEGWKAVTAQSKDRWVRDICLSQRPETHFYYRGGENGHFIEVEGPKITMGKYDGAMPHIGEAMFHIERTFTFDSHEKAVSFQKELIT